MAEIHAIEGSGRSEDMSGELAERLKEVVYQYAGRLSLAATIGTLEIVKREILDDQDR